ncbi:response regulator [Nitrosopumilus sp. b3]|uniref:response regulator n=1 Tax=Nitrosopumilus sp. b3 TaxID=2109909 RepID=UPI0015F4C423|nr:response regulator [Nitrosopumilus sp. b3]KAF6246343.1 response regulator [Nitrosopumilus sp. b3]
MKPTVLIIDDDPETAEIMSDLLNLRSIEVLALGYDGKEAVELYRKHSPDIVMMDYWMPEFDGLYGLQGIRKINSEAKVIIITGSPDHECSKDLFESKPSAIIQKPFDTNKLISLIDKISLGDTVKVDTKTKS